MRCMLTWVKSLNGIRSASLDWLEFAQSIVGEPMKVKASATDPCVFSGEGSFDDHIC